MYSSQHLSKRISEWHSCQKASIQCCELELELTGIKYTTKGVEMPVPQKHLLTPGEMENFYTGYL